MATLSAKFSDDDAQKLDDICELLGVEKSEALRRATQQLWLALQVEKSFSERAGGGPKYLLNSGSAVSTRSVRQSQVAEHVDQRAARRRKSADRTDESDAR